MLDSTRWRIEVLGQWGFSAKAIVKAVRTYEGERFSTGTIYRVLSKAGVKLKAYRDGTSPEGKELLTRLMSRRKAGKRVRKAA